MKITRYSGLGLDAPQVERVRPGRKPTHKRKPPHDPLPCFAKDDWEGWWKLNVTHHTQRPGPCNDCTPAYQSQMIAEGKCEYPETVFVWRQRHAVDEDGSILARYEELIGTNYPKPTDILATPWEDGLITGLRNYREI